MAGLLPVVLLLSTNKLDSGENVWLMYLVYPSSDLVGFISARHCLCGIMSWQLTDHGPATAHDHTAKHQVHTSQLSGTN
jgi:hypothetical protein